MSTTATKKTAASPEVVEKLSAGHRYVKIPQFDVFKKPWSGFSVNKHQFLPGQTYLLEPVLAGEVERILEVWQDALVRTLRPDTDDRAINAADRSITMPTGPNVSAT